MTRNFQFLLVLALLNVTTNLSFSQGSYTPFKQLNCVEKASEFYLFYEGETLDFEYEKLGEVTSY